MQLYLSSRQQAQIRAAKGGWRLVKDLLRLTLNGRRNVRAHLDDRKRQKNVTVSPQFQPRALLNRNFSWMDEGGQLVWKPEVVLRRSGK